MIFTAHLGGGCPSQVPFHTFSSGTLSDQGRWVAGEVWAGGGLSLQAASST